MHLHQSNSSGPKSKDGSGIGDANTISETQSRSVRRRNLRTTCTCSISAGPLGRNLDTHSTDAPNITVTNAPSLNSIEKSFIEKTHGVNEVRNGFFEAIFLPPEDVDPFEVRNGISPSISQLFLRQGHDAWSIVRQVSTTRSGIRLLKSFLGFFLVYILCLVPTVRDKVGRYAYIMVISAIMNHPGRTIGAQVDGTLLTILGTATGLGWGAFGLWLSTVTTTAQSGSGAILALFLFAFIFIIACLRSYYPRTYQLVICAGIAICYTCLAEISATQVSWSKQLAYGIPWLIGQAVSLVVCIIIAPDGGSRSLAAGIHEIFDAMVDAIPPVRDSVRTRRRLAQAFVAMSHVYRDLVIDFSITTLNPKDALMLRNSIQAVIRALLSLREESRLSRPLTGFIFDRDEVPPQELDEFIIDMGTRSEFSDGSEEKQSVAFVTESLAAPMGNLLHSTKSALQCCDAALMDICGHRRSLGPPYYISNDVHDTLIRLRGHVTAFNDIQEQILRSDRLPLTYSKLPDIVKIFAFCRPVHQAASTIASLAAQLDNLQQRRLNYPRFHAPSYPFRKAMHRTNAQVRHDRGGVTAGSYFRNLSDIAKIIKKIESQVFHPVSQKRAPVEGHRDTSLEAMTDDQSNNRSKSKKARFFYSIWTVLHRMQGFETRFGLKTALVVSLLALPAYLPELRGWWDDHQAWWAAVMSWLIMGPRTGGNVQDLLVRLFCAVLGSLWAGLSYAAGSGNPYVIAAFAVIFMLPMLYRHTQSDHPVRSSLNPETTATASATATKHIQRSGLVGCISFTFVSLSLVDEGSSSVAGIAAIRGVSIVVGVAGSVIVNWILWPFVARHEIRKGIASMIFNCSVLYRSTMAQYVYYDEGHAPTNKSFKASEILEGRLREGFVRLRELLGLTQHEIRLRAPFDPLPYSELISSCERFFEHIVTVRQSSSFYRPHFIQDNSDAAIKLLGYRRDAIAAIIMNLYVLSGALRANRPVPIHLPNVAIARKRLLDQMFELEREHALSENFSNEQKRQEMRLGQIYRYSYDDSLTGCVEQVRRLEMYTKIIVGQT
ncbi:hypothetical protein GGS21DRAFT_46194 [Xylaria nigripes]|nr:hypothetical protein GGS21DRAFT_46194 [Xylaria nigripes]